MPDISERYLETIKRILAEYVGDCEVRAFGSRVCGTAKNYSDLDIAIVGAEKIKRRVKMLLKEAFEKSDLPFRVDVVDYNAISDSFRAIIEDNYEIIQDKKEHRIQ
ncbi:MAG: nucleotidyltransferase domain-containing protein [Planctomycetes bacterium]|nr:nucleotidyltransferase domain-containing protein [Planctomycetota bacterium]MBU1518168.1 nucleotidyltransferase domain-containing protein [Planctomycetota bacterium]MBU2457095.1 nucleotidyltransferase domain-containing protein [Planctomycetota bacterium]MBU2596139.1 nucleotidyltransferase domain-containing protein [Planctomycetota bacterium]